MNYLHTCLILCLGLIVSSPPPLLRAGVILDENFDDGVLEGDWVLYHEFGDSVTSGFETRPEHVHSGSKSFRLTSRANDGKENGSNIRRFFMPGVDQCYFRWYAKFAEDFDQGNLMHWVIFGGSRVDDKWSCYDNTAGRKPTGTDFFWTFLDTWRAWGKFPPPGRLGFYSYFPEMIIDKDGHYWGNMFSPEKPLVPERGKWYCYEVMVKLNEPGEHDGEQAFWVDGEKIYHQSGIRWRDTYDLKLNSMMLDVYVHQSRRDNTCWFDDVKISTEYIGPEPPKAFEPIKDPFWGSYYPNPFSPPSIIRFTIEGDKPQPVKLEIYRLYRECKELVRTLVDEIRQPGSYREPWNGRDDSGKPLEPGWDYRYRVIIDGGIHSVDLYLPEK